LIVWHERCVVIGAEQKALAMITATTSAARPADNPADVLAALASASRKTGSDFDYLLATARRESNFDSRAKSTGSSATGLFQFVEQTWLSLIKRFGARHGLDGLADAINETQSGRLVVASPEVKSAILALREDAGISALMAGEAARATKQSLETALGRPVRSGELYAAHFLGESGARRLIGLNAQNAGARADLAFPEAAKANRNVFYHRDGSAKTIGEVHAWAAGEPTPRARLVSGPRELADLEAGNAWLGRSAPVTAPIRLSRDDAQRTHTQTIRRSRFGFAETSQPDSILPRGPIALSAAILDVLAAFAPPLAKREGWAHRSVSAA
jgi:hypothetical protein